jgi:hypothetical protein
MQIVHYVYIHHNTDTVYICWTFMSSDIADIRYCLDLARPRDTPSSKEALLYNTRDDTTNQTLLNLPSSRVLIRVTNAHYRNDER